MPSLPFRATIAASVVASLGFLAGCSSIAPNNPDGGDPVVCNYGGQTYTAGTSFPACACNTCTCSPSGSAVCTRLACIADGGSALPPTCSLGATYTFRNDGGFVAYTDSSTLTPPNVQTISRDTFGDAPLATCSRALPCDNDDSSVPGTSDINAALADPDVVAALAMATPQLYGTDTRPVDGTVFVFQRDDGRGFQLGAGDVPPGLRALQMLLARISSDTVASPGCANLPSTR